PYAGSGERSEAADGAEDSPDHGSECGRRDEERAEERGVDSRRGHDGRDPDTELEPEARAVDPAPVAVEPLLVHLPADGRKQEPSAAELKRRQREQGRAEEAELAAAGSAGQRPQRGARQPEQP